MQNQAVMALRGHGDLTLDLPGVAAAQNPHVGGFW
jgi:hypothetical protein